MNLSEIVSKINKKVVLGVIATLVIGELVWAGWSLTRSKFQSNNSSQEVVNAPQSKKPSISLMASETNLKVGDKVTVTATIYSPKATDGVDLVINFDPRLLQVESSASVGPVTPSTLYSDYPANQLDDQKGEIFMSGISSKPGGVTPNGVLGTMVFVAKAPGKAKISLGFKKGNTTDSNITEAKTAQDILEVVNNVELNIK